MAVCKFFLQGKCKFGEKCRFEHPAGAGLSNQNTSAPPPNRNGPFTRTGNFNPQSGPSKPRHEQRRGPFPRELGQHNVTKKNVEIELKQERPLWVLSAFAPGPEFPAQLFEGYPLEQSFEEVRVEFYLAVTAGKQQEAMQNEQDLAAQANQQVTATLQDLDGALWYLVDSMNHHPNRLDILRQVVDQSQKKDQFSRANANRNRRGGFSDRGRGGKGGFPRANTGIAFGSSLSGGPSFGQTSNLLNNQGGVNNFTQPPTVQLNKPQNDGNVGFGAPISQVFQSPITANDQMVDAPMTSATTSGFPNFNMTASPAPSAFGIQNNTGVFDPFNNPNRQGDSSTFGNVAVNPTPQTTFGQPVISTNFANPNPPMQFSQHLDLNEAHHGNMPANTPQVTVHSASMQEGFDYKDINSYTTRNGDQLLTWKGQPVQYINGNPCVQRSDGGWERIWFPNGPPQQQDEAFPIEEYPADAILAYEHVKQHGSFLNGNMPETPPKPDMNRFDV